MNFNFSYLQMTLIFSMLTSIENKLTLNTKKSNLVIFRSRQKKIRYLPQISIFDSEKNRRVSWEHKSYIKYLAVLIENLSWKTIWTVLSLK